KILSVLICNPAPAPVLPPAIPPKQSPRRPTIPTTISPDLLNLDLCPGKNVQFPPVPKRFSVPPNRTNTKVTVNLSIIDWLIMLVYFAFVLGIGFALKRYMRTSNDFFLACRSIRAWVCGLAFISAYLGGQEVLGMGASVAN